MKRIVAALLVLTMVLALAGTALASSCITAGMWVEFKKDTPAYTEPKSSKKTTNLVQKGSTAWCDKVCGNYARVIVNEKADTKCWFRIGDLCKADTYHAFTRVVWARGGQGMSTCRKDSITYIGAIKGFYVKVSGHTNLFRNPGMKFSSQGMVEKGKLLKLTGYCGFDDRDVMWVQVCYKGKKVWLSTNFVKSRSDGRMKYYDKDGNCAEPTFE
ncbi:MAG: hypothetical protein IKF98_05175 [Clostridia bacterium]|nr:hypothetical protein [Clostridia bacterium]